MPITNPQRAGLQLGPAQLTSSQVSLETGIGATSVDSAKLARSAAINKFLSDATDGFTQRVEQENAKAAVRGALDATYAVDPEQSKDERVASQNILLRSGYESGYTSAAVTRTVTDWRTEALARSQKAAEDGLTDDEYLQQEQEYATSLSDNLGKWLPSLDAQGAVATLDQIRASSAANLSAFKESRAKIAYAKADTTLDENLTASGQEFFTRLREGSPAAAESSVIAGMGAVLGAQHLDKDKKVARVKDYLVSIAQNTDDPVVIDRLQKIATDQLGINSVDVNKALLSEFKRAGNQMEASVRFNLEDQLDTLKGYSPEQQEAALARIRTDLQRYGQLGVLGTGAQLDIWRSATKLRDEAADKYAFQAALDSKQPSSVLAGMYGGDVDKARKAIENNFSDDPLGNANLLQYGKAAKDAFIVQRAHERTSKLMADTLASLDSLGEDGTVSAANNAAIASWVQFYQSGGDLDRVSLSSAVPEEYRGIIQRAAAQGQSNASNIILDDVRRLARNKASGRYDNLPANPPEAAIDAESTANWFSFGDTADAQRTEGRVALQEEYKALYRSNPELLVGKSPEDINTLLKGNIQSRKIEVEVAGKPRHVYLPAGTKIQDFMGSYRGDAEQFRTALSQQIQVSVDAVADPSKVDRVIVQAGTAGAQAQNLTATVITTDGIMQNISIDNEQVQQLAQQGYNEALAGGIKIGEQAIGSRPATFWDADNGRTISLNVNGKNSVGLSPAVYSDIIATTAQFEGFRATKAKGSVGFGLHDNSGLPVPDKLTPEQGIDLLKGAMEKQYIPAAQKQLKGVTQDPSALKVIVDLNYHGGNGSSQPVAEVLRKLKGSNKSPVGYANNNADGFDTQAVVGLNVLKQQPAYKQAQASRKKYLETNYWQAVQAVRLGQ